MPSGSLESQMKAEINKELSKVPEGRNRGLLRISGTTEGEVELRIAQRIGKGWSIGGVLDIERGEKPKGGVEVVWSW